MFAKKALLKVAECHLLDELICQAHYNRINILFFVCERGGGGGGGGGGDWSSKIQKISGLVVIRKSREW